MELQRGLPLLCEQFTALFKKNLLLSWRSKRAMFLQLFSSFFFILLLFVIQKATESNSSPSTGLKSVEDPKRRVPPTILRCEDTLSVKLPCFDFVWSGNESRRVTTIVRAIMANNPGRPIPIRKVKSFGTTKEVDEWLFANPMRVPGALHFAERNATVIGYGIQFNSTIELEEDSTFKFQIPLQIAAEREISRYLIGDPNFGWVVGFKEFAHPAYPADEGPSIFDGLGPVFFLTVAMFGFVFQISSLISEKELKLRQAMTMMGLFDSAYWFSWLIWEVIITTVSSGLTVLFGMMFQFDFFLKNGFVVVFLLFALFQFNMIGLAFTLSSFISKSSSATTVGFFVFIVGFITQLATSSGFPYASRFSANLRAIWSLFPPNLFSQGLTLLSKAIRSHGDPGITWSRRAECVPNINGGCVMTINDVYLWLVGSFVLWFTLAIYLDNIIPNASGVRKSIFYFLRPGYWTGRGGNKVEDGGICGCEDSGPPLQHIPSEDEDVIEEESTVIQQTRQDVPSNVAVQIRGLIKTYPGTRTIGCCCKCKRTSPYHAIKGLWLNIEKDQLFCLLGPNGAGKTTTINCLTGITPATYGDALIYGDSIRSSVGMSNIRRLIGVCPQFDILWDALSGEEHLHLFSRIKGLPTTLIQSLVDKSLADVKLTEASKVRAGSYSGGMKRRLSVAVALIGDPKLVFLDEPTTGMDPITRRHVWDIIQDAKRGRAIVLTTHSMEEADILSDRIGIMAKGRLRCIGTSIRLKSRFGTGFIANVSFAASNNAQSHTNVQAVATKNQDAVKHFFRQHLNVTPVEENKSFFTFVIPRHRERLLTNFFAELQDRQIELGIADIQLGLATLEEVFLNIARQAELENAVKDGTMATLTLMSGLSVKVPTGARFVGIPGTESSENPRGLMVEVFWEEDDNGGLCISSHSSEMSIPSNVTIASPSISGRNSLSFTRRRREPVHGFVIDPALITRLGSVSE